MENHKNKKSVKFQGDMLNFCDFIQVFVFTTNHHLNVALHIFDTYCKYILGVHAKASNLATIGELGRFPLYNDICEIMKSYY